MITVGVMQVTFHQIIDVIPVRDRFVTAACAVLVRCIVAAAGVLGRANVWVRRVHSQRVLIHVAVMGMMKMPIVKVIDVSFMLDGQVPTIGSVGVIVAIMGLMFCFHAFPLSL